MMTPDEAVRETLRRADGPVPEHDLMLAVAQHSGVLLEGAREAVARLHGANEIRWVAFRGYMLGGRPS